MGLFEMKDVMSQAHTMQKEMKKRQKELERRTFEGSSGGGMVVATLTGKQRLTSISIDPALLSGGDLGMLQDLIKSAVNDSLQKSQEAAKESLSGAFGGMGGLSNLMGMLK